MLLKSNRHISCTICIKMINIERERGTNSGIFFIKIFHQKYYPTNISRTHKIVQCAHTKVLSKVYPSDHRSEYKYIYIAFSYNKIFVEHCVYTPYTSHMRKKEKPSFTFDIALTIRMTRYFFSLSFSPHFHLFSCATYATYCLL